MQRLYNITTSFGQQNNNNNNNNKGKNNQTKNNNFKFNYEKLKKYLKLPFRTTCALITRA